jgi:serine/threonine protein phosphatase PrpC
VGVVRQRNEDRALIAIASYPKSPEKNIVLATLCDGIGGLADGNEAAVLAITTFISRILRTPRVAARGRLVEAVKDANFALYTKWAGRGGATLSSVMLDSSGGAFGVNVGDSRVYGIAEAREVIQLSKDDTLGAVLGDASGDPHLNRLIQYVGMVDPIEPHFLQMDRSRFSSFLLTTDGVHGSSSEALSQVVKYADNTQLIERLIGLSRILGGRDNGSAIILPSVIEPGSANGEQGLNLTFISPTNTLEIWVPVLAEGTQDTLPPALTEAQDSPVSGHSYGGRGTTLKPKRRHQRKSNPQGDKERRREKDGQLPLSDEGRPTLDVKFPDKKE